MGSSDQRCSSDVDWHALARVVLENYCGITLLHVVLLLCLLSFRSASSVFPHLSSPWTFVPWFFIASVDLSIRHISKQYFDVFRRKVVPSCNVWIMEYFYGICFSAMFSYLCFLERLIFGQQPFYFAPSFIFGSAKALRHPFGREATFLRMLSLGNGTLAFVWRPSLLWPGI